MIITEAPIYMIMFTGGAMGHFIAQVILSIKYDRSYFNISNDGSCHALRYNKNRNFCYLRVGGNHYESIKKRIINLDYDLDNSSKRIDRRSFKKRFRIPKKDKPDIFYITKEVNPWYLTTNHFHFSENDCYDTFENTVSQFPNLKFLVIQSYESDIELLTMLKHKKDIDKQPYKDVVRQIERDNNCKVNMLKYLDSKSINYTTIEFRNIIDNPLLCYNIICDYLGENSILQQDILQKWNDYISINEKLYGKL